MFSKVVIQDQMCKVSILLEAKADSQIVVILSGIFKVVRLLLLNVPYQILVKEFHKVSSSRLHLKAFANWVLLIDVNQFHISNFFILFRLNASSQRLVNQSHNITLLKYVQ